MITSYQIWTWSKCRHWLTVMTMYRVVLESYFWSRYFKILLVNHCSISWSSLVCFRDSEFLVRKFFLRFFKWMRILWILIVRARFAYLSSANSDTNNIIKFIEPPAAKPDKNWLRYVSVAFVDIIFKSQPNYTHKKSSIHSKLKFNKIIRLKISITPCGTIKTINVYLRPNTSPFIVKNTIPIRAPT